MRTSLLSTVAAIALIGASAPFAVQAGSSAPDYQMAAGEGEKQQSGEMQVAQTSGSGQGSGQATGSGQSTGDQRPAQAILSQQQGDQMLVENLIGASVRTAPGDQGEEIGTINNLVIDADRRITAAVIGVGGFLGVGEKNVAVTFDQLEMTMDEGSRVFIANMSRDQLEQAPEFVTRDEQGQQGSSGSSE